jgi:hypothetical protein
MRPLQVMVAPSLNFDSDHNQIVIDLEHLGRLMPLIRKTMKLHDSDAFFQNLKRFRPRRKHRANEARPLKPVCSIYLVSLRRYRGILLLHKVEAPCPYFLLHLIHGIRIFTPKAARATSETYSNRTQRRATTIRIDRVTP